MATSTTKRFSADETQLLHLVAHSLYSDEDIFLREMISNASDALDKRRFFNLKNPSADASELALWIDINKEERTLNIRDHGIGMTYDEVIENLGTIAKSGTKAFREQHANQENTDEGTQTTSADHNLIGQFGVGFYSAFVVADRVTVTTRHAGSDAAAGTLWTSEGKSDYDIENTTVDTCGTTITLHLKKDKEAYLDAHKIREIICKFSDHIAFPIYMLEDKIETPADNGEETDTEKTEDKAPEYQMVNQAQAIWTRSKKDISDEEYKAFYKHISHDFNDPQCWTHNQVEGSNQYTLLLYLPKKAPFDLWYQDMHRGLKLYVQRTFIMDEAENFLPLYLRFIRGTVDANDLPLNISRELLQDNKTVNTIRSSCVKRVLSMLENLANNDKDKYQEFWNEFGQVLKEGMGQDFANKDRITQLLRFSTTHQSEEEQNVSIADYMSRMQDGQDKIYYVTADNFHAAKNSPLLEMFRKKNIEVLLLSDRVDEWLVAHLTDVEGKQLQSIAKGDIDLNNSDDETVKKEKEEKNKTFESTLALIKTHLKDQISDVRLTQRLTDSPSCVVYQANDMGGHMQRLMQSMGQNVPQEKPILELNPEHKLVISLNELQDDDKLHAWSDILLQQALLAEGHQMKDPSRFIQQLNSMWMDLI